MAVKDILIDKDGDVSFYLGDFNIGLSDTQHKEDIILSDIGGWKKYPLLGVGVNNYLNSPNMQKLEKAIRLQLEYDSFKVDRITIKNNKEIYVDANRL